MATHTYPAERRGKGVVTLFGFREVGEVDGPALFFLVFNSHRLKIFRFEDLPAIETLNVVDAVPARDHLRALVVTGGLHKKETEIRPILMIQNGLSREGCYFRLLIATLDPNFTVGRPDRRSGGRVSLGIFRGEDLAGAIKLLPGSADVSSGTRLHDRPRTSDPGRH